MLRSLYDTLLALAETRLAPLWLACVSFAESSFFPLPPDVLLIPMILAAPRRAWWLAALCTLASVLGGCFGYWIGAHLFGRLALPVLRFYHAEAAYQAFIAFYARWGFWAILIKGLTPIPFKLVTIASGAAHFDFTAFIAASFITRGFRFFLVEALPLRLFGDRARAFIERRLALVTWGLAASALAGFAILRLL